MSLFHLLLSASLPLWAAATPLANRAADPTVTIASGVVVGTTTGVPNQPAVTGVANAYLGVPFASSPPLRFAPPAPPSSWSSPLKAQSLPDACPQSFGPGSIGLEVKRIFNDAAGPPPGESEDCLYLNIYAPQDASPSSLKPVLVWLFGGNLAFGTGSLGEYSGNSLAVNEDVVVVTPNYRTNIFGFSNSPEIPLNQQNSGLLDQRLALQWVRENIEAFGGNASEVTIFGESAGAFSVKQLLAQPPSPLPFRAAIMESPGLLGEPNSLANYNNVTAYFGCANAPSPIACLRAVDGSAIETYVTNSGFRFSPVTDDTFVASNTLPEITNGTFANVPLLIGNNLEEVSIFLALFGLSSSSSLSVVDQVYEVTGVNISSIYPSILNTTTQAIADTASDLLTRITTDLAFTCPVASFSSAVARAGRQPVWRYRYDGNFSDVSFGNPNLGAYHGSEIPSVFGTYPLQNEYGAATPDQIALSSYMQQAWASFARDPQAGPGWPKLGSNSGVELGVLGGPNNRAGENTEPLLESDYPCLLYYPLLLAAGFAY